jgi:hypothetical protein
MAYVPTRLKPISSGTTFSTGSSPHRTTHCSDENKTGFPFQAARNGHCASRFTGFLISHPVSEISAEKGANLFASHGYKHFTPLFDTDVSLKVKVNKNASILPKM